MDKKNIISQVFRILAILLVPASFFLLFTSTRAKGNYVEENWSDPVNLSQSGGARNPVFVIDSNDQYHVAWQDTYEGIRFSNRLDNEWSESQIGLFPFVTSVPTLIADNDENVHAFWKNERGQLVYSRIAGTNFGVTSSWIGVSTMADSALVFSAEVDSLGIIHLAYINNFATDTTPAGVYYRNSTNNGASWSPAVLLDESPYFRTLQLETANIRITTSAQSESDTSVYIVWDNLPLRRVFLARSADSGLTWEASEEIDGPRNTSGLSNPFNLNISASQEDVLLVWQVGQKGVSCAQYYQHSTDRGDTWSDSKPLLRELSSGGCPQENRIIGSTGAYTILMTNAQNQIFLTAWDGSNWSNPKLQNTLSGFIDPVTQSNITLSCLDFELRDGQLMVVGCGTTTGEDIWYLNKPIGDLEGWFPLPSTWTIPDTMTTNDDDFISLQTVADGDGGVHALWLQPNGIFHAKWSGEQWIISSKIINGSFTESDELAVTIDPDGILYIAWTQDETGEMFYSWANSSKATDKNEWTSPSKFTPQMRNFNSPDIAIDDQSTIFITYNIPINEGRGVYLVQSEDTGITWSDPKQIFDAADAGWELMGQTQIGKTGTDRLAVTWEQGSISRDPFELHFSTYDKNTGVITPSSSVQQPITWSDLQCTGLTTAHGLWQSSEDRLQQIWHTYTNDLGETWAHPSLLSSLGEDSGPTSFIIDKSGQVHLNYFSTNDNGVLSLQYKLWDQTDWSAVDSVEFLDSDMEDIHSVSSVISSNGELMAIFSMESISPIDETTTYSLNYTKKVIDIPDTVTDPNTELTPTAEIPTPTLSPSPEPTPELELTEIGEIELTDLQTATQESATNNLIYGIGSGVLVAIVIVILSSIVVAIIRRIRR